MPNTIHRNEPSPTARAEAAARARIEQMTERATVTVQRDLLESIGLCILIGIAAASIAWGMLL